MERRTIEADGLVLDVAHVQTRGGRGNCVLIHEEFARIFYGRPEKLTIALADCAPAFGKQGLTHSGLLTVVEKVRLNVENVVR